MRTINATIETQLLVNKMNVEEKINQLSYRAKAIPCLDIKEYVYWNEGLHGVGRSGVASVFPQAIAMASTFNNSLIYKISSTIGIEARAKYNQALAIKNKTDIYQGITLWSPNINIFRDPRWGRGQETYGEDPYLTMKIATQFVKGLQHINYQGYRLTDATIKHFYAHSGPEQLRHSFNANVSKRDQEETYQRAFKYVIKHARPKGVMGAYNRVNDAPCCGDKFLIDTLLRKSFGHKGYFVSDCWAIEDFHKGHKITQTPLDSALKAFKAGCDLACGDVYKHLHEAYQNRLITEQEIDTRVSRLIKSRFELGMFDKDCEYHKILPTVINCTKHQKINLIAAEESIVLLKNNGILPIDQSKYKRVAVIGNNADNINAIMGNYSGTAEDSYTIYQGIKHVFKKSIVKKAEGCSALNHINSWLFQPLVEAISLAMNSDLIILVLGIDNTMEGEENDAINSELNGDKSTLSYSESQLELIEEISKQNKPTILINVSGSPLILPDDHMDAVIQQFYGGQFAGLAIAHILSGKSNPSGRLPVTFYQNEIELPDISDYNMSNRTYKYFKGEIQYPFGSGLSYTTFSYENASIINDQCYVNITNVGMHHGSEIIMVFANYPEMENGPHFELVGYRKLYLKKGQTKKVKLKLTPFYTSEKAITYYIGSEHPKRSNQIKICVNR